MTDRSTLDRLRDCRSLLLAMEAVGWLHMTGKAHPDFLREQAGQKTGYKYQDWHKHEAPQFPWDDLLAWVTTRFSAQFPLPSPLTEFITKHEQSDSGVLGLLQAAHGITSGIEKNLPRGTSLPKAGCHAYVGVFGLWLSTTQPTGRSTRSAHVSRLEEIN